MNPSPSEIGVSKTDWIGSKYWYDCNLERSHRVITLATGVLCPRHLTPASLHCSAKSVFTAHWWNFLNCWNRAPEWTPSTHPFHHIIKKTQRPGSGASRTMEDRRIFSLNIELRWGRCEVRGPVRCEGRHVRGYSGDPGWPGLASAGTVQTSRHSGALTGTTLDS